MEWVQQLIERFRAQKGVHNKTAFQLLIAAKDIFTSLETVETLTIGEGQVITVCGDTHGQFYDLMSIFKLNGMPSEENPYLFNGDFVDRGSFSVEVIFTLLAFKVRTEEDFSVRRLAATIFVLALMTRGCLWVFVCVIMCTEDCEPHVYAFDEG